ncbi:MAG: peroxiredoxin-like family protein [Proteobacteria bacterium]|nr:peroxiredoxin-like family protein [Pseudomonadota bacterium]
MSDRIPPDRPPNPNFEKSRALRGPLSAQLASYDEMLCERNPATGAAYQGLVEHLIKVEAGKNAPAAGDMLPPFLLPDENGRLVSSDELLSRGPLVVTFNRGNWCPYCWLELSALADHYEAIIERRASVVSITPDVATYSRRLKKRLGLGFPVLTDLDNGYALEMGLSVALTDDVKGVYDRAGIDLGIFQRSAVWFLPIPATLVVGGQGIIRHAYVNEDFRQRFEPDLIPEILAELT